MSLKISHTPWLGTLLAGAIALGTLAPVAEAGHGKSQGHKTKGHKGTCYVTRVARHPYYPRYEVYEHSHGYEFASFVGGLIFGVAVSHAASAPPPPRDYYYDPYCDVRYSSFDACEAHVSHCRHPQVVQVIEIHTGRTVDQYHYAGGRWRDQDGDDWDGKRR